MFVYELTAHPTVAVPVLCAKFGWEDVMTAHWLGRRDPDRKRARCCWWFYMALAQLRIGLVAFGFVLLVVVVEILLPRPARQVAGEVVAAGVTVLATLALAGLTATIATCVALASHVKVWVHPATTIARRQQSWPPQHGGRNLAEMLLLIPFVAMIFALVLFGVFGLLVLADALRAGPWGFVSAALVLIPASGVGLWWTWRFLVRRVVALKPSECWREAWVSS